MTTSHIGFRERKCSSWVWALSFSTC